MFWLHLKYQGGQWENLRHFQHTLRPKFIIYLGKNTDIAMESAKCDSLRPWNCTELFHNLTPLSVSLCFLLYPLVLTTTIHLLSYSWSCNLLWIICNDLFFFIYNILKVVMYLFNGVQCTTVCIFPPFILKCYTAAVNLEPDALAILTCYSPKNQIWSPF